MSALAEQGERLEQAPLLQLTAFEPVRVHADAKPWNAAAGGVAEMTTINTTSNAANSALLDNVLQFDRIFAEQVGMAALRPEAKLLLILTRHGSMRIKQAMSLSGLSYRGFYILLRRLVNQDLVLVEGDSNDRRVRNIRLRQSISISDPSRVVGSKPLSAVS